MNTDPIPGRPLAREDVLFRQLDDQWVIFDPVTDRLHALNLSAALVWTACTGERRIDEIVDDVAESFDPPVDRERTLGEVTEAIERFREQGLLIERH